MKRVARKAVRGVLAVFCVALAVFAPVDANWETGEVEVAEAVCQGPHCMPVRGWICEGRDDECNLKYQACRDSSPPEGYCMHLTGWICEGRENMCNLKYARCRESEPTAPDKDGLEEEGRRN